MTRIKAKTEILPDGESVVTWSAGGHTLEVSSAELPKVIHHRLLAHGLKQKVADAAAGEGSLGARFAAMRAVVDALAAGVWSSRREGVDMAELLARAVAEYRGVSVRSAREFLAARDLAAQRAIARSREVAPILARILAESADDSADDLLDGLR